MPQTYDTPQEAEDAYYDALEEGNLEQLLSVWADSDDVCCLLPMYPMLHGRRAIEDLFSHMFSQGQGVELLRHVGIHGVGPNPRGRDPGKPEQVAPDERFDLPHDFTATLVSRPDRVLEFR